MEKIQVLYSRLIKKGSLTIVVHTPSLRSAGNEGYVGKNPSPTSAKNKSQVRIYKWGATLTLELAFGVELGLNSHSKILSLKDKKLRMVFRLICWRVISRARV